MKNPMIKVPVSWNPDHVVHYPGKTSVHSFATVIVDYSPPIYP